MKLGTAWMGGVTGGAVISGVTAIARSRGIPVDIETTMGTLTGITPGTGTWVGGLVMFLTLSGAIGLLYGVAFERFLHRAGALAGAALSVAHVVIAGSVLAMLPAFHPMIPEQLPAPGAFLASFGPHAVVLFLASHAAFGVIVGLLYGRVEGAAPVAEPREWRHRRATA
jgi:hypothetical protein